VSIFVDDLRPCGAPWRGGVACHLVSDRSKEELLSFAAALGIPRAWFQAGSVPHFDLSPSLRARAVRLGAKPVDRRGLVDAVRRYRQKGVET
jgi:uncharacterized protein DUF4031